MSDQLQALFQLAQSEHAPAFVRRDVVAWLADQGRLAIVRVSLDHCPFTDATLPTPSRRLHATADDMVQARGMVDDLHHAEYEAGGDDWFEIWDHDGGLRLEPVADAELDEVPF